MARKLKALNSKGRSDWANSKFDSKDHELFCFRKLVLGCPIPGVAANGNSIRALDATDDAAALEVLNSIFDGMLDSYYCSLELRQIAKKLISTEHDTNYVPKGGKEFACFSKSPAGVLKDCYGLFCDIEKKRISAEDAKPFSNILILDALYRHLRNGLAHGSFTVVKRKSPKLGRLVSYIYLQDVNKEGHITARLFLSYGRIEKIASVYTVR